MTSLNSQSTRDNKMIQNYPTCAISGHGRGGYIQVLYGKDLLGSSTAEALLNMVWFNNTIYFGFRGWKEHREMCWGDVNLRQTSTGQEYLELWQRNQNSFRKQSSECKSHCTENVCCAEQQEMSSKGLQSLHRKVTRGNKKQRCTVLLGSKQCKIWLCQTLVQKSSSRWK